MSIIRDVQQRIVGVEYIIIISIFFVIKIANKATSQITNQLDSVVYRLNRNKRKCRKEKSRVIIVQLKQLVSSKLKTSLM